MSQEPSTTCDVDLIEDDIAIDRIKSAIDIREPFSMVRINDGEAVVLAFDDDCWLQDAAYLQGHWGGERVPLSAVRQVRNDLRAAIDNADLIGVRNDVVGVTAPTDLVARPGQETRTIVARDFPLRPQEREQLTVSSARRIALHHHDVAQWALRPEQELCSCWLHWEMLACGALNEMLESIDQVTLVTARSELESLIRRRFDIDVRVVQVPDKFVEANMSGAHVPDRYATMRRDLDLEPGSIALVGAGIPGKVYCDWLKRAGCVAIDVGAVLDAWVGKASRPRVLESRFSVPAGGGVPPELQLRRAASSNVRTLTPRWKAPLGSS